MSAALSADRAAPTQAVGDHVEPRRAPAGSGLTRPGLRPASAGCGPARPDRGGRAGSWPVNHLPARAWQGPRAEADRHRHRVAGGAGPHEVPHEPQGQDRLARARPTQHHQPAEGIRRYTRTISSGLPVRSSGRTWLRGARRRCCASSRPLPRARAPPHRQRQRVVDPLPLLVVSQADDHRPGQQIDGLRPWSRCDLSMTATPADDGPAITTGPCTDPFTWWRCRTAVGPGPWPQGVHQPWLAAPRPVGRT